MLASAAPTIAAAAAFQGSRSRLKPRQPQPLRIVAIGDSLVYGYGDPSGGGWVERLRRQWMHPDSPGHVIYNLGVRGDKVFQTSDRLEAEFRHRGELRNRLPDLLVLSVGTNDSPRVGRPDGRNMTDLETFGDRLEILLDRARHLCPVLFVGMVPADPQRMPFMDCLYYHPEDQYRYKEMQRRACQARNIPYLDCFDRWMARGTHWIERHLGPDGLHPNEAGYQSLLQDVLAWEPVARLSDPEAEPRSLAS